MLQVTSDISFMTFFALLIDLCYLNKKIQKIFILTVKNVLRW